MNSEYHGLSGRVLSPSEKASIQVSFVLLTQETSKHIHFWGKVFGVENDYLLCQATSTDLFTKQTFYSVDGGLSWMLLDPITDTQKEYCRQLRGLFQGNPQYEYKIEELVPELPPQEIFEDPMASDVPKFMEDAEEDDEEEADADEEKEEEEKQEEEEVEEGEEEIKKKDKKKKTRIISVQETLRLSHFVDQVDFFCNIVPRGAYLLNEHGKIIVNKFFEGLSVFDSGKLSLYCHSRRKIRADASDAEDPFDFMETINNDVPKGVWSLKFDPMLGVVVACNLLFPGFTFYHKPQTTVHGQYYFGDGQQNFDLCFML